MGSGERRAEGGERRAESGERIASLYHAVNWRWTCLGIEVDFKHAERVVVGRDALPLRVGRETFFHGVR